MGSILDNKKTAEQLDEGSEQLGIWHPDDIHEDDGNIEIEGTSTSVREGWQDAEIVKTQEKKLRHASDDEEAALYEESTATSGSPRLRVTRRH